jgi:hypothetical protein
MTVKIAIDNGPVGPRSSGRAEGMGQPRYLQPPGDGGNYGGMDQVWAKLKEHDTRFDRMESKLDRIDADVSGLRSWIVGTAGATIFFVVSSAIALLGLVYAARQDTTATVGAAITAIQTVLAAKDSPQAPPVIVLPQYPQPAPSPPVVQQRGSTGQNSAPAILRPNEQP